jgi:two-component sensor histidine kinase
MAEWRPEASAIRPTDLVIESNHRIANHLSALAVIVQKQVRLMQEGPPSIPRVLVMDVLTETMGKILAVARLHHRFAAQPEQGEVDLNQVLTAILQDFTTSGIFGDRLRMGSMTNCACLVDASQASMLTLVFSEIVTNAIKYAHPTGLPVEVSIGSVSTPGGGVAVQIADDGVGFPEGFDELRDAGVGLKLVRSLVENAGGHLSTKSDALGLTFSIELPPARPGPAKPQAAYHAA